MILTGKDIQQYIDKGLLKISPVEPDQFKQNGIDIFVKPPVLNLVTNEKENLFKHGCTHLAETRETFSIPNDLMAFVLIRSSWARKGLFPPGTVVDAGFKGSLTIELFNGGPDIKFFTDQRIIHLIFAKLTNPTEPYSGFYQNQKGITLSKYQPINHLNKP